MSKEIKLPSGAALMISVSPYKIAWSLFQAILEEGRSLKIDPNMELADPNLRKDLFCALFSSKKVEACVWECMRRVTYNGLKVDESTFEPVEARGDFISVCFEVAQENVLPFMKSLYAQSNLLGETLGKTQA